MGEEEEEVDRKKMVVDHEIVLRQSFEESRIIMDKKEGMGMGGVLYYTVEIIKQERADVIADGVEIIVEQDDDVVRCNLPFSRHVQSVYQTSTKTWSFEALQKFP